MLFAQASARIRLGLSIFTCVCQMKRYVQLISPRQVASQDKEKVKGVWVCIGKILTQTTVKVEMTCPQSIALLKSNSGLVNCFACA